MSRSSLHSSLRLSLRSGSGKRFDTCRSLSLSRLIGSRRDATESTTLEPIALVHKVCPTCNYQWGDKYNKDECPKCLEPLSSPTISKRLLGEASTPAGRQHPMSAMESYSGVCSRATGPDGGPHHWKFGKCVQCGKGEGEEAKERLSAQWHHLGAGGQYHRRRNAVRLPDQPWAYTMPEPETRAQPLDPGPSTSS